MLGVGLLTVPISLTDNGDIAKGMNYDHAAAIPGFTDCLRREQPNTVGRSEMLGRGAKKREPKCFVRAGFQWLRQRKRSGRRGCRRGMPFLSDSLWRRSKLDSTRAKIMKQRPWRPS